MAKTVQSTCNYCGVGCSIEYHLDDSGNVEKVAGKPGYPVNDGIVCPKGFKIHDPIVSEERGQYPTVRKDGQMQRVSWDEATKTFADRVKSIQAEHGKDSVAFISTGQMYTGEMALLGHVARNGMGMDGDGNTRQCMASAVVAMKKTFGFDSPPMTYKDIEESDCVVLVGSNMPLAHPIVWNRFKKNPNNPDLVVLDPRNTDAAKKSSLHIPIRPKTDVVFLNMVIHTLITNGWINKDYVDAHTKGFDNFKEIVSKYDPNKVEELTGIPRPDFDKFVELMRTKKKVTFWWTMGVNQSHVGVRTAQAIMNLCLITGNIGKPGAGPCSLTGQANAMGSRLYSNTTGFFAGRDFTNQADRDYVGEVLGLDPSVFPEKPTTPYDKILEKAKEGKVKGLWIICTNPVHSWIANKKLAEIIKGLDLFVVQDIFPNTLSAQMADIYFPAAGAGEKTGFLINSERRLGVAQKIKEPPGEALPDFDIFLKVAKSYGCEDVVKGWETSEKVFQLLKKTSKGMPCDITGIRDFQHIIDKGGIQWPYPENNPDEDNQRRLFSDGKFFTPDGKANLEAEEFVEPQNQPTADFPFCLLTGRGTIFQFHTDTRTGKSATLRKSLKEKVYAEINLEDASKFGISDGDEVKISSSQSSITVDAVVGNSVRKGYVFIPMHYPEANYLLQESFDSYSRQPSYKMGAVKIESA